MNTARVSFAYCPPWTIPILLMVIGLATACGGNRQQNEADTLAPDDTLAILTELIRKNPNEPEFYAQRADVYYSRQMVDAAMADIQKALDLNSGNAEYYYKLGFFQKVKGQEDQALANFQKAVNMGTFNPEPFYEVGNIFFLRGDYPRAIKFYDLALKKDSTQANYYFAKALVYHKQNKIDEAIGWCKAATMVNPKFIKGYHRLFDIYMNDKKDPEAALEYNLTILSIDSLHPVGRFNMGYYFQDRYNRTVATDPLKAEGYLKHGITQYGVAIKRDPNYAVAYYNRGYAYLTLKDYDNAIADFRKVTELTPNDARAHFMLGSLNEYFKDYEAAASSYQAALKANPNFADAKQALQEVKGKIK